MTAGNGGYAWGTGQSDLVRMDTVPIVVFLGVIIDTVGLRVYPSDQRLDYFLARLERS